MLQLGSAEVAEKAFSERQLGLEPFTVAQIPAEANSACGILIAELSGGIGFIRSCIESLKDTAQDSGLAFAIIVPLPDQLAVANRLTRELDVHSRCTVNLALDTGKAAEFLARWNPGPPLGNPKISTSTLNVDPRHVLLLRRSFHDCERIYLEPLGGGRDAPGVFCVHAWLQKSTVGTRPLPFFVKLSSPKKIADERSNYERYADFYIPFYLRPNIVPPRCAEIAGLSALVGNFVEDSIPLRTALRTGQTPGIIFSLFEVSLKGFRSQPPIGPSESYDETLATFIRARTQAEKVEPDVIAIAQTHGVKLSPKAIETLLCDTVGALQRRFSPYHGDMHSGNAMIRGKDAILIDFSAVKRGPLTADPAALEISLVFGTDKLDKPAEFKQWKSMANEMYDGVPIHQPPALTGGPGPFSWLYKAVREIRHILLGCDCKQEEAAEVLAAYLLRFARLSADKFEDKALTDLARSRQAYALVIAERIVKSLAVKKAANSK